MDLTISFITEICCHENCGITWAMTESFNDRRRNDHKYFYCPNGHRQHYVEKSDLEIAQAELNYTVQRLNEVKSCAETKKRRIASLKGVITKMRNKNVR